MKLTTYLAKTFIDVLSPSQQQTIARNIVDWLYADYSKTDREEKADRLAPRLKGYISEGKIDPRLVIFQHLKQLLSIRSIFQAQDDFRLGI